MENKFKKGISMLIPVFNPGYEIMNTLKSIEEIDEIGEIIIINDYSNQNSTLILRSININKVRVIDNYLDKGISGALNTGINSSTFEYIARIDNGDICKDKKRFKKILKIFSSSKNLNLVCSSLITESGKIVHPRLHYVCGVLSPFSIVPHPTWVFKKELIKFQYRDDTYRFEDYAFLVENKAKIYVLDSIDVLYDTNSKMLIKEEIKLTFRKVLFFCLNNKNKFQAYLIASLYILLRFIRLVITREKVI